MSFWSPGLTNIVSLLKSFPSFMYSLLQQKNILWNDMHKFTYKWKFLVNVVTFFPKVDNICYKRRYFSLFLLFKNYKVAPKLKASVKAPVFFFLETESSDIYFEICMLPLNMSQDGQKETYIMTMLVF